MAPDTTDPRESPQEALRREVGALLDQTLERPTAGELALVRHVLERILVARAARVDRMAAA